MDRLDALKAFLAVERCGGFAPAARELGMSTSAMSRHVQGLEAWFGVQLFRRTTRKISLTSEGERHLAQVQRIVSEIETLEAAVRGIGTHPSGEVRVTAPKFFAQRFLGTMFSDFQNAYPDVKLRLYLIDRVVNLVEEGFDLALRIGHLEDSDLIGRRIATIRTCLVAAPDYIARRGLPKTIDDLQNHDCIVDLTPSHGSRWPLKDGRGRRQVEVPGRFSANDGEMVWQMTLNGQGISLLPDFFVTEDINAGRLVPLLSEFSGEEVGVYVVYVREPHRSAALQALIDWFTDQFNFGQQDG